SPPARARRASARAGPRPPGSAAGDRRDQAHRRARGERVVERAARVGAVDEDVHERPQRAALVEEEIGHRERGERLARRPRLDLEPPPARLVLELRRKEDYRHTSTEYTGGSCAAGS